MANFNGPSSEMRAAFKTRNNMLCNLCGDYGRCSFPVFVHGVRETWQVCRAEICLTCKENGKRGRLIALFTGTSDRPDFLCRGAKVPPGYTLDDIQRALQANPTRRWFNLGELEPYRLKATPFLGRRYA